MTWEAVIDGTVAADARAAVDDIATALRDLPREAAATAAVASVAQGTAGLAVFFAEVGNAYDDGQALEHALALLDDAIDAAAESPNLTSLYSGTVGVGWAVEALAGRLYPRDEDDDRNDVDELVEQVLTAGPWGGHFDVVNGLVGLGVYVLRRLPRESARRSLGALVHRLSAMAEETPAGTTWRTGRGIVPATDIVAERFARYPDGYYDLGVAHGVPGVVAFLAAATEAGEPEAKELLEGATRWLRAQRRATVDHGAYPLLFGPDAPAPDGGRAAWCYGDPSVAIGLLAAGRALGDVDAMEEARAITVAAASRPAENTGVVDAGLCHGSAGLAHVCNRLGQELGDEELIDQARRWFASTLEQRRPGGVAGFPAVNVFDGGRRREDVASAGLLEGAAGVGLALLAATTSDEPIWDDLLLLGPLAGSDR